MSAIIEATETVIPTPNYEYITTEDAARSAMSYLDRFPVHSIDTEATALDPYEARMTLLQIGVQDKVFVFDVRCDTDHSSLDLEVLDPILKDPNKTRILQNASYDMKLIKRQRGYYLDNVYDTMLAEQLSYLGLGFTKSSLDALVLKYLGLQMPKEARNTFADYYQTYQPFQLDYAAKDVVPLQMIRDLQWSRIQKENLENVADLEFRFLVPLCEMELNGVCIDKEKWRIMMSEVEKERIQVRSIIHDILSETQAQTTLFGVSTINISSNVQLKKALNKYGLNIDSTSAEVLQKHAGLPIVDAILDYRKAEKLVSTYSETLLDKINKVTGRLHTDFRQMVSTGRMSSSNPNLQNIPKKQRFRSCFVAPEGSSLITADMSGAELRILGNLSGDPAFVDAYTTGQDLHTRTASDVFGVPYDEVQKHQRTAAKAINFGLCLSESSSIYTNKGILNINEVRPGCRTTHDLGNDVVIDASYMGEKEVFELKTRYGYSVELTSDHLVKVIDEHGNYIDKELKDLDITKDLVCIRRNSNLFSENSYIFEDFDYDLKTNAKEFDIPKKLTDSWASFFGLVISEGHIHVGKSGKYNSIQVGVSEKDVEFIYYIENLFDVLFGRYSKSTYKNTVIYSVNSVKLTNWVVGMLDFDKGAKTETIDVPLSIKCSKKSNQIWFLKTLFEGDGTISTKGPSFSISYSSKSYSLVKSLQTMLLNFGILSSIRGCPDKRYPERNYYKLDLIGVDSQIKFMDEIGFISNRKNNKAIDTRSNKRSSFYINLSHDKLKVLQKKISKLRRSGSVEDQSIASCNWYLYNNLNLYNRDYVGNAYFELLSKYDDFFKFVYENDIVPLSIKSINSKGIKKVYDLSVENHQYFLANGFVVHNCYGMSPKGLAKRIKISDKEAEVMIDKYFKVYGGVKRYLDKSGQDAVRSRYSLSVSGRRRYYSMPPFDHPDRKTIQGSIERQGKNMPIQGCLSFDTVVKGTGLIGNQVGKTFNIETGCGKDTARGVFSGEKPLLLLKLSNGIELKITKDHKIPTINRKAATEIIENKRAEELTEDDLLLIPLNKVDGTKTDLSGYKYTKGHWRETYTEYKYPNKMNVKLAFIIGCLIGDGSYSRHNHFRFVCPAKQRELFDKFNGFVYDQFGYKPIEKLAFKKGNTTPLPFSQVSSVAIRGFLKHIGLDYVVHESKSIPEYFYTETLENKGALLNGLFSTDGGVTSHSGPNFTTVSKKLAHGVHQLLFSMGINSNLKTYLQKERTVYRLQIHKRFCKEFYKLIGFSVKVKSTKLRKIINSNRPSFNDGSVLPEFIPKTIHKALNKYPKVINKFTSNQKAHLRRFGLGSGSYSSWRKFFKEMPPGFEKDTLSEYLQLDFCFVKSMSSLETLPTYDISCDNIHYFTANGVIVHNSNADTIKEAMCLVVKRLENYDARLILTVHDEVIIECKEEQKYEVAKVVEKSIIEGFGKYFSVIPMETDALIGPCWLKSSCESPIGTKKCGCSEMKFVPHKKLGTKLVCSKCGADQD